MDLPLPADARDRRLLLVLSGPARRSAGREGTPLQVVGAKFGILPALLVVTPAVVFRTVQPGSESNRG